MEVTTTDLSAIVYATISEVKTLTTRSEKVLQALEDIKSSFNAADYDSDDLLFFVEDWDSDEELAEDLQPLWTGCQERFIKLLHHSSNSARLAQEKARVFSDVILPCLLDETTSVVQKFDVLVQFVERENPIKISDEVDQEIATLEQEMRTMLTSAAFIDHLFPRRLAEDIHFLLSESRNFATMMTTADLIDSLFNYRLVEDTQLLLSEIDGRILANSISGLSWIWSLAKYHAALLGDTDLERIGVDEVTKARIENLRSAYKALECALEDYSLRTGSL
ncbi:hypothetical protein LshimejAT787_1901280 [Lyophyllum shimeji]|uniref:Uncharacterized protein n=1 Tax=Lyophyllum shimeji TaxID=47721 RepID=A0A9P3PZW7_LYOSH|nr:hypothetical protein LshimejAT787_1901280 [Lyophyllum shimeji]